MPMYEYKCEQCGREFEQLRRMADADRDLVCPECSSDHIRRLLSCFATGGCGTGSSRGFT
jgi:putative FmdB family regulatory protein